MTKTKATQLFRSPDLLEVDDFALDVIHQVLVAEDVQHGAAEEAADTDLTADLVHTLPQGCDAVFRSGEACLQLLHAGLGLGRRGCGLPQVRLGAVQLAVNRVEELYLAPLRARLSIEGRLLRICDHDLHVLQACLQLLHAGLRERVRLHRLGLRQGLQACHLRANQTHEACIRGRSLCTKGLRKALQFVA
eukprot:CAMPEP_0195118152 /NCGR_PEP_ID=MMETSP0448-20130528/116230_1 /TAXON_ID=66468 /ORGANISM="Heterocapsa triquestra, Strain CCMP 448" /LENGTH=190 /DNA_ID=CAMNT_0040155403 /DNA_START=139 /DNA_END=711 /DNA_ORIENTATION=-